MAHDKRDLLEQAVANAVFAGGRVESQTETQAVVLNRKVSVARTILCALVWWPGFLFGHHRSSRRQVIRIDRAGNTLIQDA